MARAIPSTSVWPSTAEMTMKMPKQVDETIVSSTVAHRRHLLTLTTPRGANCFRNSKGCSATLSTRPKDGGLHSLLSRMGRVYSFHDNPILPRVPTKQSFYTCGECGVAYIAATPGE
eukprot:3267312-Amphidinium_carterae.7